MREHYLNLFNCVESNVIVENVYFSENIIVRSGNVYDASSDAR